MKSPFDILEKIDEVNFRWLEAAQDLQSAKSRIEERQALSPGEYVVFDRRTQQIVAKSNSTIRYAILPPETLRQGQLLITLSVVSEARGGKKGARARCVCALSIQRLEGRRWRFVADAELWELNRFLSVTCRFYSSCQNQAQVKIAIQNAMVRHDC